MIPESALPSSTALQIYDQRSAIGALQEYPTRETGGNSFRFSSTPIANSQWTKFKSIFFEACDKTYRKFIPNAKVTAVPIISSFLITASLVSLITSPLFAALGIMTSAALTFHFKHHWIELKKKADALDMHRKIGYLAHAVNGVVLQAGMLSILAGVSWPTALFPFIPAMIFSDVAFSIVGDSLEEGSKREDIRDYLLRENQELRSQCHTLTRLAYSLFLELQKRERRDF